MGQLSFFDLERRTNFLTNAGNPLERLNSLLPWEIFRKPIERALRREKRSDVGRKPYDAVMMFKILVLQRLYGLSDEQTQYQINDRLSFQLFLDIGTEGTIPDQKTIWLFREQLTKQGVVEKLFKRFEKYLRENGYRAQKGTLLDATIIEVPIQRNNDEENRSLREEEIPEEWVENPNKLSQKDVDAKWTKKYGRSSFGYKNHINADRKHKLVRKYEVTPASVHESQVAAKLLKNGNTNKSVWGDSAYSSDAFRKELKKRGYTDRIQKQGRMHYPLTQRQRQRNESISKVRKAVEHVFAYQVNSMKADFIRCIGLVRAQAIVGLNNLTYNLTRFVRFQFLKLSTA